MSDEIFYGENSKRINVTEFPFDEIDGAEPEALEVSDREGATIDKTLDFFSNVRTPDGALTAIYAVIAVLAPWKLNGKSAARIAREAGITKQCLHQSMKRFNEMTGIKGRLQRSESACDAMRESHRQRKKAAAPAATVNECTNSSEVNGGLV